MKYLSVSQHIETLLKTIVDFKKRKFQQLCPLDLDSLNLWIHKLQVYDTIPLEKGHFLPCVDVRPIVKDSSFCWCRAISGIEYLFKALAERYPDPW